jgi:hypothetical protein
VPCSTPAAHSCELRATQPLRQAGSECSKNKCIESTAANKRHWASALQRTLTLPPRLANLPRDKTVPHSRHFKHVWHSVSRRLKASCTRSGQNYLVEHTEIVGRQSFLHRAGQREAQRWAAAGGSTIGYTVFWQKTHFSWATTKAGFFFASAPS